MKNKLKGLTLLETVLYIGLFSAVLLIFVTFMLNTQEATTRTQNKTSLHKTTSFIAQHINYTFESTDSIDGDSSIFETDIGKLDIIVDEAPKVYELQNSQLFYDGVLISSPGVLVERFYLTPIYEELDVIAVRIEILLRDSSNTKLTEEINFLAKFR